MCCECAVLLERLELRPLVAVTTANPQLYTYAQDLEAIEVS